MKFSYVIPTHKAISLNEICIKSIRQFHKDSEIILVSDGDPHNIHTKLNRLVDKYNIKLLKSYWNNYFAHSVNRGIDAANSDVVILTNNDIIITENIENEIQKIMESDPLIGAVGFLLYYPDKRIQHGGMKRLKHTKLMGHHDHGAQINDAQMAFRSRYSIGCTGALLALRKTMTDEIGVLRTVYKLANEDVEMCLRIWHTGWRIYYTANVSAIHAEGFTRGRTPQQKQERGFWKAEEESIAQFHKDILMYDVEAIDQEVHELNGDKYISMDYVSEKRFGIIRKNALGDCICTTGIIEKLAKDNPGCKIFIATKNPYPFENNPNVSGIIEDKKYISNHADDIIDLDLVYEKEPNKPMHKAYADHVFGEKNYNDFEVQPILYSNPDDRLNFLMKIKKEKAFIGSNYVVLHIGGNTWKERFIELDIWSDVIKYLLNEKYTVVVVGKKGDFCIPFSDKKLFNLIDKLTLSDIHQLIINAKLFIGIDSGILHIAQCTNTKCIGIFTVADPKTRIHRQHWTKIIEPQSECKYCLTYKIKPPVTFMECMNKTCDCKNSITASMIIDAVKSFDNEFIAEENMNTTENKSQETTNDKNFWKVQFSHEVWKYFQYGKDNQLRLDMHHNLIKDASEKANEVNLQIGVPHDKNEKHGKNWIAVDLYDKRPCIDHNMDLSDLKFEDNKFNFIECNAVLEHVKNPFKCAAELYRVCKVGGEIWAEVPYMQWYHPFKNYNEDKHGILCELQDNMKDDFEHGGHYFNFTPQGICEIMKPFKLKKLLLINEGGICFYGVKE